MTLFTLGETVIDTRTHEAVTITAIITAGENSLADLYILSQSGGYYISDDEHLIAYDKYYWDDLPLRDYITGKISEITCGVI